MDATTRKSKRKPWYQAVMLYGLFPLVLGSLTLFLPTRARWNPPGIEEGYVELTTVLSWELELTWIDARSREEFDAGSIPGAVWMDATDFESQLMALMERWAPGMEIVVFCGSAACDASHHVAERLRNEAGLPAVWVLTGGWESWKRGNH